MFVISGELYEDEEMIFENFEEYEEEDQYEPNIDTYTMLSFIMQDRFNPPTVCLCF